MELGTERPRLREFAGKDHEAVQEVIGSADSYPPEPLSACRRPPRSGRAHWICRASGGQRAEPPGVLGYVLARRTWGNGYATASAAVLEKIGMRQEGYLHHQVYVRDEWQDRLLFATT